MGGRRKGLTGGIGWRTITWRIARVLAAAAALGLPLFAQSRPAQNRAGDEVALRIIVVPTRAQAEAVAARVAAGETFATLARQMSTHVTASEGGFIGRLPRSSLSAAIQQAIAGLEPGRVSPVLETADGFAVLTIVPEDDVPAPGAAGAVRYMLGVDGLAEANSSLDLLPKGPDWNMDPLAICEARTEAVRRTQAVLAAQLTPDVAETQTPAEAVKARFQLGQLYAFEGRMDDAIRQFEAGYARASGDAMAAVRHAFDEVLGIAYLHASDMDNGLFERPDDRCLLPGAPGAGRARTDKAERAVEHFLRYLEAEPDALEVRWLLSQAYMALGRYPDGVPPAYLIPPSAFASGEDIGRFVDVAPAAGLVAVASSGGAIVDDFDGDNDFDVVTSSSASCGPMRFFRNQGNGTFVEASAASGLGAQLGGLNLLQGDYNNDGCLDILNLRGGWQLPQRNSLLRNRCDGTFTDVTVASGLALPTSTQAAVWTDIDNDGWLDLFVGNEEQPAQLFRNQGDGTFQDIAARAGVARTTFAKGVAAADYDNDGHQDLYVSNFNGFNVLYRNNGDGTFTDVTAEAGVPGPGRGFATWFFDYDNDGWADLFATSFFMSVDETARTYLGGPHNAATLRLYRNRGDGTFEDVTARTGLAKVFMPMGSNFGDLDNDGFLDMYLGTGSPSYGSRVPNVMLRNQQGQRFVDVTQSTGTGEVHKGHGVAFVDLDADGDQDIVIELGGATPGDAHAMRLFENPGHGADWLGVRLVGQASNRFGVGARIAVTVQNAGAPPRTLHRTVGSGGSFGASPLEQHIGLGRAARIVDVEVWWPAASNTRQRFTAVDVNQTLEIREGAEDYENVTRPMVRLGGPPREAATPGAAR